MKIGVNIIGNGAYDEPRLTAWLDRLRPPAVVVMNNGDLVGRLATRYPGMIIICRHWPDDNACATWTPAERMRVLTAYSPVLPNVYLYTQNEPEATARCAAWECEMMDRAAVAGQRLVVGNFGFGGPEDVNWRGPLHPLLDRLADSTHLLGLHSYFDRHNWRAAGYDPLAGDNWLIGRFQRMLAICDEMDIPRPRVVITEHGSDSLYDAYHGWRAGIGLGELDYAAQLIDMDAQIYTPAPEVVGTCVFCWDATGGNWETFNIKDAPELQGALAAYAGEGAVVTTQTMTVTVLQTVKKRAAPNLLATQTGSLAAGTYTLEVGEETQMDGYCWRYFKSEAGEAWYSATGPLTEPQKYIALAVVVPDPEPEPEPEPEPTPDPMTAEKWLPLFQGWLDCLTAWEVHIAVQKEAIAAWETSVTALKGILRETIDGLVVSEE